MVKHLLKTDLSGGNTKNGEEIETGLERKKVRKMFVDPIHGVHGFFLCENELFYNNFTSKRMHEIRLGSSVGIIRSLEIYQESIADQDVFELLIGTDQG